MHHTALEGADVIKIESVSFSLVDTARGVAGRGGGSRAPILGQGH